METNGDWIPLSLAAKLFRSPRTGRCLHIATVWRWIQAGTLSKRRCGRWWLVNKSELATYLAGETPEAKERLKKERGAAAKARLAWNQERDAILREHGFNIP